MPIDPNIALGVKPIEQPNMLAQMGQMMQLRQMQQENESNNALRDFYASGGNASTAEGQRQLMSKVGLKGMGIIDKQSEISARDVKTQADSLKAIKDNIGLANTPQAMAEYLRGAYSTPGGALLAKLVPLETALSKIPNDPKAFAEFQRNFGLTTDKLFTSAADQLQAQVTREGHGVTARGQDLTNARALEGTWSNVIVGRRVLQQNSRTGEVREVQDPYDDKGGTVTVGPITNLPETPSASGVVTGRNGNPAAPMASGAVVPAKPNMLPETVGATPSVNALRNPPVVATAPAPKTRPPVTNPLMVEEKPVWNEKAGVFMYPPSEDNPKGKVVEVPAIQEAVKKRAANETLKIAGFDPKTGSDEISELIKKSTSGLGENWASKAWGAITGTGTSGAEAIAKLETRAHEMTLGLAPNGSLGAGFSNEDREFMLRKLGDVANANAPMNIRLAAWEDVMERAARTTGTPYRKSFSSSAAVAPSTALPKGFKLD